MKYLQFSIIFLFFLVFNACDSTIDVELPLNEHLLFQNSYELEVTTTPDSSNFPIFNIDIAKGEYDKIFIAVSNEILTVTNNTITNTDAIIWQWHSGMSTLNTITYDDGELLQPNFDYNGSLCCNGDTYYWSAWAWNEKGEYIEASTGINNFSVTTQTPSIVLDTTILHYESGGDGYAQKAEDITLRIFVKNTSNIIATDVRGTFSHPLISELPQILNYGDIAPNTSKFVELSFKVPNVSNDDLKLDIDADFTYNQTLTYDTIATQYVALLPCVNNIILDWSYVDFATIDTNGDGADVFFKAYTDGNFWTQGQTIVDQYQSDLPLSWYYPSCEMYDLVTLFTFEFLDRDYNPLAPSTQHLGSISFRLGQFADQNQYPEYVIFQNNEVHMRLEVTWL